MIAGPFELRPLRLCLAPHEVVFPRQGGNLGQPGLGVWPEPAQDRVGQAGGLGELHLRHREHRAPGQYLIQPQGSRCGHFILFFHLIKASKNLTFIDGYFKEQFNALRVLNIHDGA